MTLDWYSRWAIRTIIQFILALTGSLWVAWRLYR